MAPADVSERRFEETIESFLLGDGGYTKARVGDLDRDAGIDPARLVGFIKRTQPDQWDQLRSLVTSEEAAEKKLLRRVVRVLDTKGTIELLRRGFSESGIEFKAAYFAPAHSLTPELVVLCNQNELSVMRQVPYSPRNHNTLDMALFVNGLPVATAELKNQFTRQSVVDSMRQYREDRDPNEAFLSRRAIVHFAADTDLVYMTTRLKGTETEFLPFNRGLEDGTPGNPVNPVGHRTAYLWETIWSRESWLEILQRFVHVENPREKDALKRRVIFPRFHQLDAVRRLVEAAKTQGPGNRYLIEHSAGSGKSNTIAWLSHRLAILHDSANHKVYDKVIVVSDRRVLDQQLQDTIYQFEHRHGVIERIDERKTSQDLANALRRPDALIIITTLQKFPVVLMSGFRDAGDRSYAVVIDEAHSSQTGEASKALREVLASGPREDALLAEAERAQQEAEASEQDTEDEIAASLEARGFPPNLSFFAFTATPKAKTLVLFGQLVGDKYRPFHLYTMKQAIKEGFILDVLANYTTYTTYWRIENAGRNDPLVDKGRAAKSIARYKELHPTNLAQKAAIIVDHFRARTRHRIDGRAKAMVVTSSRLHAVRYKLAIDSYIADSGFSDVRTLVAFSGDVFDPDVSARFSEAGINGFGDKALPKKFETDDYQVLIVAEKYQTGFDQPLLHTMYVDKKLEGIKAVQTLSRLNRKAPGKDDTFVLDFYNDTDRILDAFRPYYELTEATPTDSNVLSELRSRLDDYDVVRHSDVEEFAVLFFIPLSRRNASNHGRINAVVDRCVERFRALSEVDQQEYRDALGSFVRKYSFLSQIVPFSTTDMEKFFVLVRLVERKLPRGVQSGYVDVGDLVLTHLWIEKTSEGSIEIDHGGGTLTAISGDASGSGSAPQIELLSSVIKSLNDRFGTKLDEQHRVAVDQYVEVCALDGDLAESARVNSVENWAYDFERAFSSIVFSQQEHNEELFRLYLDDAEFAQELRRLALPIVYQRLKGSCEGDSGGALRNEGDT